MRPLTSITPCGLETPSSTPHASIKRASSEEPTADPLLPRISSQSREKAEEEGRDHSYSGRSVDKRREKNKKRGKESVWKRLKMVCVCWLLVVVMAFVCVPGFGSMCWDSSICNDLSNKARILECIQLCTSVIQTEYPDLNALALKVNDEDDLLLSILLASLVPENKISESDLKAHSDQRRSYSMEHFRWGKPTGRKRRPVKVFASSLEGGGSSEGSFPPQARRQLSSIEDEAKGDLNGESHQNQGLLRARVSSKSHVQLSPQERKDGTYQMSHFRWGSPPVSKRNGSFMKTWEEKPQRQLAKLFRNIIVKDVQRIMG